MLSFNSRLLYRCGVFSAAAKPNRFQCENGFYTLVERQCVVHEHGLDDPLSEWDASRGGTNKL